MRFDDPNWLFLLVLLIPLGFVASKAFASMSPARKWASIITRGLLLTILAALLAGASTVRTTDALAVVALVDTSGSVRRFAEQTNPATGTREDALEATKSFLRAATINRGPDDLLGIVAFDSRAIAVATPSRADVLDRDFASSTTLSGLGAATDIAAAIRLGRAMIPPDARGRLVLISDGVETIGDALESVAEGGGGNTPGIGTQGPTPIDVVGLPFNIAREVVVESLDAPPTASSDAPMTVRVVLSATEASTGTIRLLREGETVDINGTTQGTGIRVALEPGRNVIPLEVRLGSGRVNRFRAVYEPDIVAANNSTAASGLGAEGASTGVVGATMASGDTAPDNNVADAFTIAPGRGVVLLVDGVGGGREGQGSPLATTLRGSGLDVRVVSADQMPRDILSLEDFDLVILENIAADQVPESVQGVLLDFVRELGGGLVMVGGPDALGAGGWRGSTLEAVLPVELDLPDRLVTTEVATVLVLDNSGSMRRFVMGSTQTQQRIANEAAAIAVKSLDRRDEVGVISFNTDVTIVVPLERNTDSARTAQRVRAIYSDGGTFAPPAIEAARKMLARSNAKVKHIVLVTDGKSRDNDRLVPLAQQIKSDGIRLTTISVGDDADTKTLKKMAEVSDGVFYEVSNPEILPRIFLKAVRIVRSPLIKEGEITPIVLPTGSPMTQGLAGLSGQVGGGGGGGGGIDGGAPLLGGLVITRPRDDAIARMTITMAMATSEGEPLLAHWNVGLGQVVVFASDASTWASGWVPWAGYQRMWSNIARSAARPGLQRGVRAEAVIDGEELRVTLEALDEEARPLPGVAAPITVYTPSGKSIEARLSAIAPGVYEARVPIDEPGSYVAVVKPQREGARMSPVVTGATVPRGSEFRTLSANEGLLTQIAERSGGRRLNLWDGAGARLFDRAGVPPREAVLPLWPMLMPWLIAVFVLDVAMRRVAWDRWISKRFGLETLEATSSVASGANSVARRAIGAALRESGAAAGLRSRGAAGEASARGEKEEITVALGEKDAEALRMQARDRRQAERLGVYRADVSAEGVQNASAVMLNGPSPIERSAKNSSAKSASDARDGAALPGAGLKDATSEEPPSLLSAKKRARERFNSSD